MAKRKKKGEGGSDAGRARARDVGSAATGALSPRAAKGISRSTADTDAPPASAGAPKPIRWTFFRRYRILFLVYTVGLIAGVREYTYKKDRPEFEWLSPEGQELLVRLSELDPNDPDSKHLRAMNALAQGDDDAFNRLLDSALATGAKHNEKLFRNHAAYLLATGAPYEDINAALNRWRVNFPFSIDFFPIRLPSGPQTEQQAKALEAGLAAVPWISESTLERHVETAEPIWVVQVRFRRGRPIDVRDVYETLRSALGR